MRTNYTHSWARVRHGVNYHSGGLMWPNFLDFVLFQVGGNSTICREGLEIIRVSVHEQGELD